MSKHEGSSAREILGAERRDRARVQCGECGGVQEGAGFVGLGTGKCENPLFGRSVFLAVVMDVPDNIHTRQTGGIADPAARNVEVALDPGLGVQVSPLADHRFAESLHHQGILGGTQDFRIAERQSVAIEAIEIVNRNEWTLAHDAAISSHISRTLLAKSMPPMPAAVRSWRA